MKQYVLAGVFVIQAIIVGGIWFWAAYDRNEPEPFLTFDTDVADRLIVRSSNESIELKLQDDKWVLPDTNPADESKVTRVLEKLAKARGDWPVATSESTAKRFEVTEETFQKHISVFSGDEKLVNIYLGTSPTFRKVHARSADGGPVYAIEFSNHEAGTTKVSWLNKQLLRPEGDITKLELVGAFSLSKGESMWTSDPETELDESKVRSYIDRFETLTVYQLSDEDLSESDPKAQFRLEDEQGEATLNLYHLENSDQWVARSDRHVSDYGVATYVASELVKELSDLAPDTEESEEEATVDSATAGNQTEDSQSE